MHDSRHLPTASPVRRLLAATGIALILVIAATTMARAGSEYNSNPTYCHQHGPLDPLWYYYECWLPDPPGDPY